MAKPTKEGKPEAAESSAAKPEAKFSVYRCGPGASQEALMFTAEGGRIAARESAQDYAKRASKSLPKRSAVWFDVREEK
ncbi:MAG TPA: hypothetical protein VEC14_07365 [Reyranellaceae bacterium]|nr:hypothetical protein [Reyranellaceae bacterium]